MYSAATLGLSSQLTVAAALMISVDTMEEEIEEEFCGGALMMKKVATMQH